MNNEFETTIKKLSYAYNIRPLEPSDLQQELRIALWLNRAKYDKNKGSYKSWAYKVCRNKLKDLYRKYKDKVDISLEDIKEKGFEVGYDQEIEQKAGIKHEIKRQLSKMTPKQREVYKRVLEEQRQTEIATELEITQQAVSKRYRSGFKRL
jgi:RNA polymerase sigma factor (sigma-70 family)